MSTRPIALLPLLAGVACGGMVIEGSGVVETRRLEVEPFFGIEVCCEVSVEFVQNLTDPPYLELWTDDNLQDQVEVTMDGGTLRIGLVDPRVHLRPVDGILARVFAADVKQVELLDRASFSAFSLTVDKLTTTVDEASSFWIGNLTAATLWANVLDGSGLVVEGRVSELDARVRRESQAELGLLSCDTAKVVLDDGSYAEVWVDTSLTAIVRGKSTLAVWGDPAIDESVDRRSEIELLGTR